MPYSYKLFILAVKYPLSGTAEAIDNMHKIAFFAYGDSRVPLDLFHVAVDLKYNGGCYVKISDNFII